MRNKMLKNVGQAAVLALASVLVATPALAEGQWSSSISGARVGFESRDWYESSTSEPTSVSFGSCSLSHGMSFNSVSIALYKEVSLLPGYNMGTKTNYCGTSSWTLDATATYYFRLPAFNGDSGSPVTFSAGSVITKY